MEPVPTFSETLQTDLLADVATWGGVALAVIGAVAGIMIAMNFIKRAK